MEKFGANVRQMFEQMDTPYRDAAQIEKKNRDDNLMDDTVKSELIDTSNLMDKFFDKKQIEENWHMSTQWELEQEIYADPEQAEVV